MYKNNKADISADQVMTETAIRLTEKLRNELAEVRKKKCGVVNVSFLTKVSMGGVRHSTPKSQISHSIRQRARRYITSNERVVKLTKCFSSKAS